GHSAAALRAIIYAVDLSFRDGRLLVLDDDDETFAGRIRHFGEHGLPGVFLIDAEFGPALDFAYFGPGIFGAQGYDGREKDKKNPEHGSTSLMKSYPVL